MKEPVKALNRRPVPDLSRENDVSNSEDEPRMIWNGTGRRLQNASSESGMGVLNGSITVPT